jgi:hypothetical protein
MEDYKDAQGMGYREMVVEEGIYIPTEMMAG